MTARSACLTLDVVAVARLRAVLIGESRMGILSWLRSLRSADVAAVEEDAKFFGPDSPASQDEL